MPQLIFSGVIKLDPWLEPFKDALRSRYSNAQKWIKTIDETEGGLEKFSRGTEKFGFVVHDNGDITYREWAPNALRAYLVGDFSKASFSSSPIPSSLTGIRHKMNGTGTLRQWPEANTGAGRSLYLQKMDSSQFHTAQKSR